MSDLSISTSKIVDKSGALSSKYVREHYSHYLTEYEQQEIYSYSHIYYFAPKVRKIHADKNRANTNYEYDDTHMRYKCIPHDHIAYRYELLSGLGKGSFGDVFKAYDHKTKSYVAIKIIRNSEAYFEQGEIEIDILEYLKENDIVDEIINILDSFDFRGHLCIVFELLDEGDLFSALKKTDKLGFSDSKIRDYTKGILKCLDMLKRHDVIHCDIKPENVLIKDSEKNSIKVIDFGLSCFNEEQIHTRIQTRYYRAPEVIVGSGYGTAIDMWSLGCMIAEFHIARPLFAGCDEGEQLMYYMEALGVLPQLMLNLGKKTREHFDENNQPLKTSDKNNNLHLPGSKTISEIIGPSINPEMLDLIERCLRIDPNERITPSQALNHPFITGKKLEIVKQPPPNEQQSSDEQQTSINEMHPVLRYAFV